MPFKNLIFKTHHPSGKLHGGKRYSVRKSPRRK